MVYTNLIIVFLFGALFGFTEILQRYPGAKYNFKVFMSYIYIFLNGIAAIAALLVIKYIQTPDAVTEFNSFEIVNILIAGLAGMMILRSSVFSIKHNDETIEVGLATLFQVFLNVVEKRMKNKAAALRLETIEKIMADVNFDTAKQELPLLCTSFIDNFTDEDITKLINKVEEISNLNIENRNKSLQLGRFIASYCDEEILEEAIRKLPYLKETVSKGNSPSDQDIDSWIEKLKK